jgi:hypothetical protein
MKKIISLVLIVASSFLMMNFSSFTPKILLLFLPGFLFGISVTIPRLFSNGFKDYKTLLMSLAYVLLWCFSALLMLIMQLLTNSINDKTPYVIVGILSGITLCLLFEIQFGFANKKIGFISIILLSILACLIFDYYYPNPNDKELHIGRQILIWNVLIGIGLTVNNNKR